MHLRKKINFKIYLPLTLALVVIGFALSRSMSEFMAMIVVLVAVMLNQWMLVNSVDEMVQSAASKEKTSKTNLILSLLFKAIILIAALTFGVHIMGNRVIIPLLIYIAQIFVLYVSMKESR